MPKPLRRLQPRRSPDTGRPTPSHTRVRQPGRSCLRAGKRWQPRQRRSGL